ncbi:protein ripply3 [Ascaphus truei]|uniref:protein ripply3 n=1 Tax=Ascaphus truei TaxID=8439 RepID=UPI003F5A3AB6
MVLPVSVKQPERETLSYSLTYPTMASAHYRLKATLSHMCPCSRGISSMSAAHPGQPESNPTLWRPWVPSAGDRELEREQRLSRETDGEHSNTGSKGALGFQHPVRLYMPKSKTNEYLQHMGKKVLASFPVQATIHFYNDDSDSEDEDDDYEMELYNHYQKSNRDAVKEFGSSVEEDSMYSSRWSLSQEKQQ